MDRTLKQRSGQKNFTEDIWAHIAGHFETKEWATVAGVCKTTWNLPFKCAKLDYELAQEGISPLLTAYPKPRIVTGLASTRPEGLCSMFVLCTGIRFNSTSFLA